MARHRTRAAGFSAARMRRECRVSLADLQAAGFTPAELRADGFGPGEVIEAGFTLHQVKEAGYTAVSLHKKAGFTYQPPHYPQETVLLGVLPWLIGERSDNALVVGLGGGNTLRTLLQVGVPAIEVVELEKGVVDAVSVLHRGRDNPVEDPRVTLHVADGRNQLLLGQLAGGPRYDLIASQPSHPWRIGAANLFTEDFFRVAQAALTERGVFATWLNGFRMDETSLLAVLNSFERVFPGAILVVLALVGLFVGREPAPERVGEESFVTAA